MIQQQCKDFLTKEVYPKLNEIDSMKDPKLMPSILDKAGELGLLGTSVPQELGGFGMDFNTSMLVAEIIGAGHSVAVAISAHTGIGTLPILYYGIILKTKGLALNSLYFHVLFFSALSAVPNENLYFFLPFIILFNSSRR